MKHTIDLHHLDFQRTFLEMMLLEELIDDYNAESIESLIVRGETHFPEDPFFPAMRAYPLIREGEFGRARAALGLAVAPPRELTPAFYGCLDWHSSVHGHWLLARLARSARMAVCVDNAANLVQLSEAMSQAGV